MKDKFNMVGMKIPEFTLPNSRGDRVNIQEFMGKKVLLILLRGLMDPFCQAHIVRLAKEIEKFEQLNTEIYAITADRFENARRLELRYAKRKFPIFFDRTREVVKLLHQEVWILRLGRMPAILILDKKGIVQWAYYGDSMRDIPSNKTLFEVIEKISS